MITKYIITCLFASFVGIISAQYQNYELKAPESSSNTYVGRDYVRLLPGYSFSAVTSGKTMNAKVSSALTTAEANTFLTKTYKNGNWDYLTTIDESLEVGVIPINSSVSPTGAKTYDVPIDIVPGRMRFQPSISLSYNSQDGNGIVGVGWNIAGLSSIDRVDQNLYYDNKCGIIDFTTNDGFVLNGERLLKLSSTSTLIEYETSSGNTFVTAYISGEIVKYFKVRYPNGIVGIFGFTTNTVSKIAYPVTKLTDATGNNINFTYIEDANTYYIDLIRYGGRGDIGSNGFVPDFAKIHFIYTDNRIDVISQYVVDKTVKMTKILKKIVCYANSETVPEKIYEIKYTNTDNRIQNSPSTGVSKLIEISCSANGRDLNSLKFICGENIGTAFTTEPKTFTDQSFDLKNVNVLNLKSKSSASSAFVKFPKIDYLSADGLSLTYPSTEKIEILEDFLKDSYSPKSIEVGNGFLGALTANVDGVDGDEIIRINTGGMQRYDDAYGFFCIEPLTVSVFKQGANNLFSSTGSKDLNISYIQTMKMYKKDFLVGNFTGSGKDELIVFFSNTSYIFYLNSTPYTLTTTPIGKTSEDDKLLAIDIDGDSQTEIIVVRTAKTDVYKYKTGVGFQDIADWALTSTEFGERQIMFADLNQDGNIDIIKSPQQNTIQVEYETRMAPNSFNRIWVFLPLIECEKCHYVQEKAFIDQWNYFKPYCRPHIAIITTPDNRTRVVDCDEYSPSWNQNITPIYPRLIENNTKVETYCPGCYEKIVPYNLENRDDKHCWACGGTLWFGGDYCWKDGHSVDKSNWSWTVPINDKPVMYSDWSYQYTNGKTIVQVETINNGLTRENDYKFSIHEVNGDGVPDLVLQKNDGLIVVYPFNVKNRKFELGNQTINLIPQSFELIDVNMNDDYKNTNLLALGSNKIINIKLPYNHTRDNMVSLMVNSLGVVDKTEYTQLTDKTHYTPGTQAQYPYYDFSGQMWVVGKNSQLADKKLTSSANYNYAGGIFHNLGLNFLGFSSLTSTNLMTNKVTTTEFDPYKQGAITKQSSDTEEINIEYNYTVATNKKTTLLPLKKTVTDKLKGNTIIVTYPLGDYDNYGNTKKEIIEYGGGLKTTIVNEYENRIGSKNLIGLLKKKEVTNERDGKTSVTGENFDYNGNGQLYFRENYNVKPNVNLISETNYIFDPSYHTLTSETIHSYLTDDYLTTSYTYWDDDKCSLHTITDPLNRETKYTYDFTKRLLTETKNDYGKITSYGYDDWRRLNKVTRPDGTITDISVEWNSGNDPKYLLKEMIVTTGQPTTYKLTDAFGRVTRSSVAGFAANTEVLSDNEYDSFGRLHTSSVPYKASEVPQLNTYSYDKYDRIEKILAFNGSVTSYGFSGNTVTINTDGVVSSKTSDASGMLTNATDAGGTVTYTYRADGQPDKINAAGVETSFEYNDKYNRQTKLIDPSAGTIETQYDDENRKVKQIWNSGKEITTEFDTKGLVLARYTPDFKAEYAYEKGKFLNITYTGNSRPMSKSNTYDAYGRLWKENELVDDKTLEQEYLYNMGKLSSVTYRANTGTNSLTYQVGYKYNANGYLYKIVDENENMLREINSVNTFGQETSVGFGNGLTTQSAYTSFGSLTNINTSKIGTSNTIQNIGYDFNPINGTLNSRTDIKNDNLTESFNYGALYRLEGYGTTVNRQNVGYKANGNIESKTDAGDYAYTLNGKPYTLSGINTSDNSGQKTQLDINYTVMSRPTTISKGTYTAYIDYNDAYERVFEEFKQGTNTVSTKHLLAGGQYEVETKAGVETQRLYLDGSPYSASVIIEKVGSAAVQPYYLHRDYLGSITQVSDKFANLAAEYSYDAWGRMRNVTNWQLYAAGTEPELLFGRGYTGHEHLNKFGLINMNARLYDAVLGRFLAPDPLVASPDESNGYNRYMYASNNPLMYVDISGEYTNYPNPNDDSGSTNIIQVGRGISSTGVFTSGNFNMGLPPNNNLLGNFSGGGGTNYSSVAGGSNYNSGFGGISGNRNILSGSLGGGYSYGVSVESSFVFGFANWLFGPHHPRAYYSGLVKSTPSQYSTYTLKTVPKNVSGSGVSTAYAGGGKRQGGFGTSIKPSYMCSGAINTTTFADPLFMAAESGLSSFLEIIGVGTNTSHYVASAGVFVGALVMGRPRVKGVPNGKFYSVAYETKLPNTLYPGKSPYIHFKTANTALADAMASDATLANSMRQLGISVPRTNAGTISGGKIPNWVWHHSSEPGVMQLVPQMQHTNGSLFWFTLHPDYRGGMSIWGGGY
jgi:RHS repeat-associated protein